MPQSLAHRHDPLANPVYQLEILHRSTEHAAPSFDARLEQCGLPPLQAGSVEILQLNLGKLCNQVCHHCHVDAGPDRREIMTRETLEHCLKTVARHKISTVDLTGGAPEMNPDFRWFVRELRTLGANVIDRCNLTILMAPGFMDLPEFLAGQQVAIVASLPCYLEDNCDAQRGSGVFQSSIKALRRLNELGYGKCPELPLTLVYNPVGPSLPPSQVKLEAAYRKELQSRFGIEFTQLFTITNMPISRFLEDLLLSGHYEEYMHTLVDAFNPGAVAGLMCRNTLSVDWRGHLYDCDFNQMLDMPVDPCQPQHIRDFSTALSQRPIVTVPHCFGCTAGAGSGCQGATASAD